MDPPFIEQLYAWLTPFAQNLVRAQAAQMTQYTCKSTYSHQIDQMEAMVFIVTRMGAPKVGVDMTERNTQTQMLISVDNDLRECIGLTEYLPHRTTFTACSLQFPNCFGLPCRHIVRRAFEHFSNVSASAENQQAIVEKMLVSVSNESWFI